MFHRKLAAIVAVLTIAGMLTGTVSAAQESTAAALESVDESAYPYYKSNRYAQKNDSTAVIENQMNTEGFTLIAESEKLALFLKEETAAVRVLDKTSGYVWGTLAEEDPDNLNNMWTAFGNSIVSMEYFDESANVKRIGAGDKNASCSYTYKENAVICEVSFKKLGISFTATMALAEDHITFSLDDSTIVEDGKYTIGNVYFAPFLGSTLSDNVPGYMFVPDGSGALIRFSQPTSYLTGFSKRCYGMDYAIDNLFSVNNMRSNRSNDFAKNEETVSMPVYGIVHGEEQNALFGIAEQGAEYASINAVPSGVYTDYNWACVSFIYRQVYQQQITRKGAGVQVVQKKRNTVNPQMSVYFLSDEDADYTGMARLYSDLLTKEGKLPEKAEEAAPELALDFIMADIEEGFLFSSEREITTPKYLEQVAEDLKESGISNVRMSLKGWEPGGLNGSTKNQIYKKAGFGKLETLDSLKKSLVEIDSILSLYTNPFQAKEPQVNERQDVGISLSQSPISIERDDETVYLGETFYLKYPSALSLLKEQTAVLQKKALGVPVIDGGKLLYGEYLQTDFTSRSKILQEAEDTYAEIAKDSKLTIFRPNAYLFAYTSEYRDTPMNASQYLYETDSVPFLQIVLSGKVTAYAPYANESFYSQASILKSIEYNCWPSFILTGTANYELENTAIGEYNSTYYEDWKDTIQDTYEQISKVLTNVRGQKIQKHTVVAEGVVEVEYETGKIIVNYTSDSYEMEGQSVLPMQAEYIRYDTTGGGDTE